MSGGVGVQPPRALQVATLAAGSSLPPRLLRARGGVALSRDGLAPRGGSPPMRTALVRPHAARTRGTAKPRVYVHVRRLARDRPKVSISSDLSLSLYLGV